MTSARKSRIPLRTIAEAAGVTRMTVSLCLRNHPSIPSSTRDQVRKIAEDLGWKPDPIVSDLMAQLRNINREANHTRIAIVTNYSKGKSWHDYPTHQAYYTGIRKRAESFGFEIEEFALYKDGMSEKRLSQILWTRGIEGVIIFPILGDPGTFELALNWNRFTCATIAFSLASPKLHRSCVHHTALVMEALAQVHKLGYKRPGLAMEAQQDERTGHHWRAGFLAAQHLLFSPDNIIPPFFSHEWTKESFRPWFQRYQPDVVVSIDRPILDWIEGCGVKVPDEAGYVSLDVNKSMGPISGMQQNSEQVGAATLDLVIAGMRQHERGIPQHSKTVLIEGKWQSGNTTRAIRPQTSKQAKA